MDFVDFKKLMKKEWDEYLTSQIVVPIVSYLKYLLCGMLSYLIYSK